MFYLRSVIVLAIWLLLSTARLSAQSTLPHSAPEAEGVSSAAIERFLDATANGKTEFHSFMLLRHGKVIAEGWWNPYRADLRHTLYSCSKSFTATAVGFAVHEKRLSLGDKVISFFPNDRPDTISAYLSQLTIKDVLIMSDGMEPDPTHTVAARDSNWIKTFLSLPIVHEPGSQFLYNSLGTYILSAIVQKVTGQQTIEYLKPRLFEPLGIQGMDWETDTKGINTGGWGLRLKTEDMAKFAQLFLQKGNWNGKQVIPASWVEEASTPKIMQDPHASQSKRDSSDWLQGYGYQMWRCRHNAFRGDGAFGQFMIVMPDQDAALAITAETSDMQEEINLVWKYLLPAFQKNKLPENKKAYAALRKKELALALPKPLKSAKGSTAANTKTFILNPNDLHLKKVSFDFTNDVCRVTFQTDSSTHQVNFGNDNWKTSETNRAGVLSTGSFIEIRSMLLPAKLAADYAWEDANTLKLVMRYVESPHSETFTCRFTGNQLSLEYAKSLDFGKNKIVIQGQAE